MTISNSREDQNYTVWPMGRSGISAPRGRKVEIHTTSVDLDFYGKLDDVQAKTPPGFIRIHKSYLIHEMYVKKWEYEDGGDESR